MHGVGADLGLSSASLFFRSVASSHRHRRGCVLAPECRVGNRAHLSAARASLNAQGCRRGEICQRDPIRIDIGRGCGRGGRGSGFHAQQAQALDCQCELSIAHSGWCGQDAHIRQRLLHTSPDLLASNRPHAAVACQLTFHTSFPQVLGVCEQREQARARRRERPQFANHVRARQLAPPLLVKLSVRLTSRLPIVVHPALSDVKQGQVTPDTIEPRAAPRRSLCTPPRASLDRGARTGWCGAGDPTEIRVRVTPDVQPQVVPRIPVYARERFAVLSSAMS